MRIGLSQTQFFDNQGYPLVSGRVSVWMRDSDTSVDVFTYDGSDYVQADNPVTLDDGGRMETLFFDAAIVRVKVEKRNGDGTYETMDVYEDGFDMPSFKNDTVLNGIDALKQANPELGVVAVYGYNEYCVAPMRHYVWDAECTTSPNDGTIVAVAGVNRGRWLLLWDDEKLPCTVFGIVPNHETNISAFLDYGDFVGQWSIRMPPIRRFLSGTYTSNTTFGATDKTLYFDKGARFTNASFVIHNAIVDAGNDNYIADFVFVNSKIAAHSSWFKTVQAFLSCGAKELVLDSLNYFTSTSISTVVYVSNATISGGMNLLSLSFGAGCYIDFSQCTFIGSALFDKTTLVAKFANCNFSDYLFSGANYNNIDFGTIAGGHKIEVDFWKVTDALDADVWLAWANAIGATIADLCGRTVTTLYNSNIQEFRNGVFIGGTVSTNVNVKFTDIGGSLSVYPMSAGKSLTLDHCNSVTITSDVPFSSIVARDTIVVANNGIDTSVTSYSQEGGSVQTTFKCAGWDADSGIHAKGKNVTLKNLSVVSIGNFSWFDNVLIQGCVIDNPIHVIPYKDSSDLFLEAVFIGNTFGNNGYIVFTDSGSPLGNTDIYEAKVHTLIIKDNVFNTSGNGVQMPYFSNNGSHKYIADLQDGYETYSGNVGSCPAESVNYGPIEMQTFYTTTQGSYERNVATGRVWNLNSIAQFKHGTGVRIAFGNAQTKFVTPYLYHQSAIETAGDQFDVYFAVDSSDYVADATIKVFDS